MMMSPLRILTLKRQLGLVQIQALYSIDAPWLPKSDRGTRSPSWHLRQGGKLYSIVVRLLFAGCPDTACNNLGNAGGVSAVRNRLADPQGLEHPLPPPPPRH